MKWRSDGSDAGTETRQDGRGRGRALGLGDKAREEADERRHDGDQRHSVDATRSSWERLKATEWSR